MVKTLWQRRLMMAIVVSPALLCGPALTASAQEDAKGVYLDEPAPPPEPTVVREVAASDKYDDGKIRVERTIRQLSDNQIVNHGKFTEYYRNGQKFAEGTYEHGVHSGPWSYWHDNGQLSKTVNFNQGRPDGSWETFRADGTLEAKSTYKNGVREGTWILYHKDGKTPSVEQTYVDGKFQGQRTTYFANRKPWQQSSFVAGLREGVTTEWGESGRKVAEATFKADKLDGKLTRFSADGTTFEQVYRDGKAVPTAAGN